jgi:hypothetical protein
VVAAVHTPAGGIGYSHVCQPTRGSMCTTGKSARASAPPRRRQRISKPVAGHVVCGKWRPTLQRILARSAFGRSASPGRASSTGSSLSRQLIISSTCWKALPKLVACHTA